ncbi:MAG: hypothetical protein KJ062_21755 [Thermoanaerobaculia bacterium]|nr:hypothetical protein [Thermoanaerobaculia bacterium]
MKPTAGNRVPVPLLTIDVDAIYRTRAIGTPAPVDSRRAPESNPKSPKKTPM